MQPKTGWPFGPGYTIQVSSSFVGPLVNPVWNFQLTSSDNETIYLSTVVIPGSAPWTVNQRFTTSIAPERKGPTLIGGDATLHATLSGDGGIVEFQNVTVKFDPTSGVLLDLQDKITAIQNNVGSGGPSNAEALATLQADMTTVKTASFATFDPSAIVPLSELLTAPPLGFLHRELITPDRTGEGALTHPLAPAFGLTWEFVDVATGIGTREGAPDELWTKALQLQLVHTLGDSSLETTNTAEFPYGDAMWFFNPPRPSVVHYWLGPGITARFHWLVL